MHELSKLPMYKHYFFFYYILENQCKISCKKPIQSAALIKLIPLIHNRDEIIGKKSSLSADQCPLSIPMLIQFTTLLSSLRLVLKYYVYS